MMLKRSSWSGWTCSVIATGNAAPVEADEILAVLGVNSIRCRVRAGPVAPALEEWLCPELFEHDRVAH